MDVIYNKDTLHVPYYQIKTHMHLLQFRQTSIRQTY